eukprot:RCo029074
MTALVLVWAFLLLSFTKCQSQGVACRAPSVCRNITLSLLCGRVLQCRTNAREYPAIQPSFVAKEWWIRLHVQYVAETLARGDSIRTVFLGDSIAETLRGTCSGSSNCTIANGCPEVFKEFFDPSVASILGVGGDRTQNLLWRLQNGEVHRLNPKDVVILIGINNLLQGFSWEETALGVSAVTEMTMQLLPNSRVALVGVLPQYLQPALNKNISALNGLLTEMVETIGLPHRLHLVNCAEVFTTEDTERQAVLFSDKLHPSPAGFREMFEACLVPALRPPPSGETLIEF